ncbi:MAG: hypothetical protein CLLPBCKN_006741 [Chroococcidiopsis cubana SAG 39.79]|nr:hypothetical protein [Chroococcidiopsis cubana SAG 39.79]
MDKKTQEVVGIPIDRLQRQDERFYSAQKIAQAEFIYHFATDNT